MVADGVTVRLAVAFAMFVQVVPLSVEASHLLIVPDCPERVSVTELPTVMDEVAGLIAPPTAFGLTTTVVVAVAVQPEALVTVTV